MRFIFLLSLAEFLLRGTLSDIADNNDLLSYSLLKFIEFDDMAYEKFIKLGTLAISLDELPILFPSRGSSGKEFDNCCYFDELYNESMFGIDWSLMVSLPIV